MDSNQLARAMRWSIADGALATVMGTLTSGVFITGLALALGASELQIGILAALPPLATVMQLAGSYLIERYGKRKRLCLLASLASRLIWLPMIATLVLPVEPGHAVWIIAGLIAVGSCFNSIVGVAWLSWTKELVPDHLRIGFLSQRNFVTTLLALTLGMFVGLFLDSWNVAHPGSMSGFAVLLMLALVAGLGSSYCMSNVDDPLPSGESVRAPQFPKLLTLPLRDLNFRRVVLFYVAWNLSVNLAGPFFCVYMLQTLDLPFWQVTALLTLSSVSGLAANGFWARMKQRFGIKPVIFLATLADACVPLLWLFVAAGAHWLLVVIHLFGMFSSPLALGPNNLVLRLSPSTGGSAYMAVFSALAGPVIAIASMCGGAICGAFGVAEWSIGPWALDGLEVLFLLSFIGRSLSLLVLRRITEPEASRAKDAFAHICRSLAGAITRKSDRLGEHPHITIVRLRTRPRYELAQSGSREARARNGSHAIHTTHESLSSERAG